MTPLRIALVRQRFTPFGGAERFVSRALDTLTAQGAQITLVTRGWEGDRPVLRCAPFYLGSVWRDWGFGRCVCRTLATQTFDLVQSHERIACCDVYRAGDGVHREWLAQRSRVLGPISRLGIALNPYHHFTLRAEKKLYTSAQLKAVICNSRMVKDEIHRHFAVPENKIHVIYSGIDTESFHPRLKQLHRQSIREKHGIPLGATLFLFVGSGFERKGMPALLRAMANLPETAYLMAVGKDKHLTHYENSARRLGVASRIRFLGAQADTKPFYGAADALVLPTLYDPFPNVALEAMACGLPVITSFKSGAAELIQPGENGFVCDALDVGALTGLMEKLLSPANCLKHGEVARTTVEPYNLEHMGQKLLNFYLSLLPEKTNS